MLYVIINHNDGMIINQGIIAHILIVTTVSYPLNTMILSYTIKSGS